MSRPSALTTFAARVSTPFILIVLVLVVTLLCNTGDEIIQRVCTEGLINLVLVVGLYMFIGNSGQFSFGSIAYAAIGGYTAAILSMDPLFKGLSLTGLPKFLANAELGMVPSVLIGGLVAAVVALLTGSPLMRLGDIAGSIASFGLLVICYTITSNWSGITGGTAGINGIPIYVGVWSAWFFAAAVILLAFVHQISAHGLRLRATREDEVAAGASGISIPRERTIAFTLSGFVMGIGGGLFVEFVGTAVPSSFYLTTTFLIVMMLVTGGIESLSGAVVGTILITAVSEVLRRVEAGMHVGGVYIHSVGGTEQLVLSAILVLVLLLRPRGLLGGNELRWPMRWRGPRVGPPKPHQATATLPDPEGA